MNILFAVAVSAYNSASNKIIYKTESEHFYNCNAENRRINLFCCTHKKRSKCYAKYATRRLLAHTIPIIPLRRPKPTYICIIITVLSWRKDYSTKDYYHMHAPHTPPVCAVNILIVQKIILPNYYRF